MPKPRRAVLFAAFAAALAALSSGRARASDPYLVVPDASVALRAPAYRYANMTNEQALAELDARKILYTKLSASDAPGVRAPIRLTGRLHGVYIHSSLPPEQRVSSPFEICDARLALALDDFAALLARHGIDEVVHYTMYRPGGAEAKTTKTKRGATSNAPAPGTRHPAGLAIDVGMLHAKTGAWISVAKSFHGKVGEKTCGDGARVPDDAEAKELRALVCESASANFFTYVLTPNFNAAHKDHFHMEVRPDVRWFLVH